MNGDNLRNALCCDAQSVIGLGKGIEDSQVRIYFPESLVVDYEQRIDVLCHFLDTVESLVNLLRTLEAEGNSDYTHSEDAEFLAYSCYYRSGTSTCATTHAGSDERHLGSIAEHVFNVVECLLGSLTCTFMLIASTESFFSQLQMHRNWRVVECLVVCVAEYESDVVYAVAIHVIDSVASTSANAYYFYYAVALLFLSEVENGRFLIVCHICFVLWL